MASTGALFLAFLYLVNDAQKCPGYKALNHKDTAQGFTADLTIAGANCQAFGNDISDLQLEVQYQTKDRLNVRIYPKYLDANNQTQYILSSDLVQQPEADGLTTGNGSRLKLEWSNDPSFQFRVLRASSGEELFSTYGHVIVFEDQFLELATNMVDDYNVYGLAENIHDFHLGNNHTQTFYAVDAGNTVDGNVYGTFPFYQETRYNSTGKTTAHGVYARNAHGQEWLLRSDNITYRTLGGSFDLYFLSGEDDSGSSSALETIRQFQVDCIGTPAMQQFWTFGFHQTRWGYPNISVMRDVAKGYKDANIPLECLWNDLDIYDLYRDFTSDNNTFPASGMREWIVELHANGQYYVPIIDSNIYAPNPDNESDAYAPWQRGADLGIWIRDPTTDDFYYGNNWPGFSSWADWLLPQSQNWWTNEVKTWHGDVPFDGIWIDLSEASSFCVGSCGNGRLNENPVHPPFLLPNDPGNADFRFPEGFNVSNATQAASATSASAAQASMLSTTTLIPVATTTTQGRTEPTPGVRNLSFPPYVINNVQAGHSLLKSAIATNATHNDAGNTTEYELHNLFGLQISNATYHALLSVFPGRRPFTVGRSTFAGSGKVTSHWGGDNTSTFGSMFLSISQALTFMMSAVPMFGADTCGFAGNTDFDLCSRWMELSAFFPFYRNHNVKATISQEAYRWSSVAEASRRVMHVRYSLLNYMYTLFYYAHEKGDTVMRALAWEFPDDETLKGTFAQFLLGPSILVTPVLVPNVNTVSGVFPGIGEGTRWYDWYSLQEVDAKPQQNVTMDAPLEHINVHVRGGAILPLQTPGYTTAETRNGSFSLLVTLDDNEAATGSLYLDDGFSVEPEETKLVNFRYANHTLTSHLEGKYCSSAPLGNVTIAGVAGHLTGISLTIGGQPCEVGRVVVEPGESVLRFSGLEEFSRNGAWEGQMTMKLSFDS
ncbi:glycoside hydrolase family 31 protein [Dothistroma septosporum NZE10]|uniref:alpha-glucosidase n=1 Tax=Dothistroma septosporum (strain NZE10 / CBS 128990) TaxID=675120 RepID=N1PSU2_DOTSN|nr:glycoside hydrolase family 31 protein [Dothistroma septosporum NZE10]